jgi:hypothetical protein
VKLTPQRGDVRYLSHCDDWPLRPRQTHLPISSKSLISLGIARSARIVVPDTQLGSFVTEAVSLLWRVLGRWNGVISAAIWLLQASRASMDADIGHCEAPEGCDMHRMHSWTPKSTRDDAAERSFARKAWSLGRRLVDLRPGSGPSPSTSNTRCICGA